ncbi:MAG TPA: glycosyltransferase [Candidatus Acidoferrales bacterium]|nr:glycosyltransferase [Candidatus Acidoferrales bacterium]
MNAQRVIALLGRRDEPTDALEEYCRFLGRALAPHGYELERFRVSWAEEGWRAALQKLAVEAAGWRGCWVLMQYTALGWSRRGFPFAAPRVLYVLQRHGVRCGVVFHDTQPFWGGRIIDRARRVCQRRIMQRLQERAERVILTVPAEKIRWLSAGLAKSVFIPVGANFLEPEADERTGSSRVKTVAVFCVTGSGRTLREISDIACIVKRAASNVGPLRLVVMGRGSKEAEPALHAEFSGADVDVTVLGLLSAEELARSLASADVLLFVRGQVSTRRGSAIAGIAAGLPIVGYRGEETSFPVTEAGVLLAPSNDHEALSHELTRVLSDDVLRRQLCERSRSAQRNYFSWDVIAAQYQKALEHV